MKWRLPEEPSPASEVDIRATWSTPILSASSVASVYCNSTNNMVACQKKKRTPLTCRWKITHLGYPQSRCFIKIIFWEELLYTGKNLPWFYVHPVHHRCQWANLGRVWANTNASNYLFLNKTVYENSRWGKNNLGCVHYTMNGGLTSLLTRSITDSKIVTGSWKKNKSIVK